MSLAIYVLADIFSVINTSQGTSNTLNHVPSSIYPVKYLGNEDSIKKNVYQKKVLKLNFMHLRKTIELLIALITCRAEHGLNASNHIIGRFSKFSFSYAMNLNIEISRSILVLLYF